jgi:hypothetical protein
METALILLVVLIGLVAGDVALVHAITHRRNRRRGGSGDEDA